jgi:hypothetical protein
MAEEPKGKGLKRKAGPLTVGGWLLAGGGAFALFLLYRRYEASKVTASAAGGGTGPGILTAGGTIPTTGVTSSTAPGAPFSSYGAWLQAAIAQISSGSGLDAGQALDGITTWLGGGCVTEAAYQAITQVIASNSIGLPPGWGTSIPPLTVCASSTAVSPPPSPPAAPPAPAPAPAPSTNQGASLSSSLISTMTTNGEHVIDTIYDPSTNTQLYLTNKGGVYTVGNGFFGSVFSLGSAFVGTPVKITLDNRGGYTIWNQYGQSYDFAGPGTGADYAGVTAGQGSPT